MHSCGVRIRWGVTICAMAVSLLTPLPAQGLMCISSGGSEAVEDRNWPKGVLEFVNLPCRCRWVDCEGNFGWESYTLEYRGDAAAFNEALLCFARIQAPRLELAVREGPGKASWGKDENKEPVDWSFSPADARTFHAYHNAPNWRTDNRLPSPPVPLPPPRVTLFVRPDGIQWVDVSVPPGIEVIDERVPKEAGALTGSVYDMATGKPVQGAVVRLFHREKDAKKIPPVTVDENGRFRVEDVPEGRGYSVYVEADGYAPRSVGVYLGHMKDHRTIYLGSLATVAGRVIDTNGDPVAGLHIRVNEARGFDGHVYEPVEDWEFAPTDEEGRFLFTDLPKGYVSIVLKHYSNWLLLSSDLYPAPADEIRLLVARCGVRGKVVDHRGSPVSADVSFWHCGDYVVSASYAKSSSEDGLFERTDLVPGEYSVFAHAPDDHSYWNRVPADARHVLVVPGKVVEVELQAPVPEGEEAVVPVQLKGKPAPPLDAAQWITGEPVALADLRGKAVAVVFWRLDEAPEDFAEVLNGVAAVGVEVLAIHASDDDAQALAQYAKDHAAQFRIALDRDGPEGALGATYAQYGVTQLPTCYVIDPQGNVAYQDIPLQALPKAVEQTQQPAGKE